MMKDNSGQKAPNMAAGLRRSFVELRNEKPGAWSIKFTNICTAAVRRFSNTN